MTDGGSSDAYFDSFHVKGQGTYISSMDISPLVNLGYNATKLFLKDSSPDTFIGLFDAAITLSPSSREHPYYESDDVALSNPAKNIWTRKCGMKTPFTLAFTDDYYQLIVGIADNNSTVKYAVTVKYNFY